MRAWSNPPLSLGSSGVDCKCPKHGLLSHTEQNDFRTCCGCVWSTAHSAGSARRRWRNHLHRHKRKSRCTRGSLWSHKDDMISVNVCRQSSTGQGVFDKKPGAISFQHIQAAMNPSKSSMHGSYATPIAWRTFDLGNMLLQYLVGRLFCTQSTRHSQLSRVHLACP